ncbi:MAG: PPOX class F420-dependent oxidoreductase [Candidatus Hodarchaeales archaeon]|jgi:PPOX class probable F420-dependent enzyme
MNQNTHPFDYLAGHRTISLTTYYKNGKGVATPIEFIRKNDHLYASTRVDSYKVKRLRNNPDAKIAPCTMRGKLKGPEINVKVRIIPEAEEQFASETMEEAITLLYKILIGLSKLAFWRKETERLYLEITPQI